MTTVKIINHKGSPAVCIPKSMTGKQLTAFLRKNRAAINTAINEVIASAGLIGENRSEIEISDNSDSSDNSEGD